MIGVTNLGGLLQAEWLRLRRRPEVLLLAVLLPVAAGLLFIASFLDAIRAVGVGDGPPTPILPEFRQWMAWLREPYAFPQSLLAVLDGAWPIPFACLFLGAATVGGDFGWGTIRTALLAWSDRTGWLVARLLSLAVLAAFMLAAVLVVGALLPLVLVVAGEQLPAVDPPTGLLVVVGAQLLVAIQYAALGVAGGLVARSLAGGFLLAGGYLLFDTALAGLGVWSTAGLRAVPAFSFSGSGRALIEAANRVSGAPPPLDESITGLLPPLALPGWLSLVVVLVWLGALAALALVRLRRLDVTE